MKRILFAVFISSMIGSLFAEERSLVLLEENFDVVDGSGHPEGWKVSHPNHMEKNGVRIEMKKIKDGGEILSYFNIEKIEATSSVMLGSKEVTVPVGTTFLRITSRIRAFDIVYGDKNWHIPGIGVTYLFEEDEAKPGLMSKWIMLPKGTSLWKEYTTEIPVRENARRASIALVSHGWTGEMDVDWIIVEAVKVIESTE